MMTTMVFLSPGNAWFGRGGKRGHGRVDSLSFSFLSGITLFSQSSPRPSLPTNGFIPSRHSTHRQVAGATLIGPWQSPESAALLRGSERGRESEKASSFRGPFCFGAASFRSYRRRGNYSPESLGIVCKRSQPFESSPNFIVEFT
ncbi:unnamed protein product [Lasius platythorax]|uniref:Uncharacterized protein n=1 Tax=Lasius platythorax TaxID=488582 RepID=A0AAV2NJ94_9HYME